jgi:acid phosphatase type 7
MTTKLSSAVSQLAFRHVALASAVVLLLGTVVVLGPPGSQHCSGQEVNPGDNLVALVNGTEDATFCLRAGTYHIGPSVLEPGNGDKLIGDPVTTTAEGAISAPTKIIGSGSVVISLRGAENVLIENLDVSGAMSDGRDRFIDRSSGSGIHGGINTTLRHVVSHHNARSGIKKFNGVAEQVEVHNNGSEFFLGVGASGIKSNRDFVVRNSYIHNNIGVGVWADFNSSSLEVTDSVVVLNGLSGVRWQHREEAQGEALIARNVIQNNNFLGHAGAGGVSIASASNADIGDNTFGGNAGEAVTIEGPSVSGINIHDNVLGGTAEAPVTLDALSVCALEGVTCTNNVETAGPMPAPSPTESPSATPSPSASPTTSPSPSPSESPVPTPSPSPSGSPAPSPSPSPAPGGPGVTIAAAGDICKPDGIDCKKTSDLIVNDPSIDAVLTLGDNQYENGELQNFQNAFDPTWGRFKDKIYPSPGNHDTYSSGYKDYFGKPQFYSADVGNWHIVSLDSNEVQQSAAFLSQDLQQDSHQCELVFWHHARFSSGENHGSTASMAPLWEIMAANGVDVNLVGHDHIYERFAPQNPSGAPDPNGVRQFTVGTGGDDLRGAASPIANSEFIKSGTYGVIKMALSDGGYSWEFVDVGGQAHDSGSGSCHP